jgi:hypothetical protein
VKCGSARADSALWINVQQLGVLGRKTLLRADGILTFKLLSRLFPTNHSFILINPIIAHCAAGFLITKLVRLMIVKAEKGRLGELWLAMG